MAGWMGGWAGVGGMGVFRSKDQEQNRSCQRKHTLVRPPFTSCPHLVLEL